MNRRSRIKKTRRSFFGHFIYPKIQLKFSLINSFIFLIVLGANSWLYLMMTKKITKAVETVSPDQLPRHIESLYNNYFTLQIGLMALSSLFVFLLTNLILHRFLGPIVSIIRYFEDLKNKGEGKLSQRAEDCLTPLHDYLKTVDVKVTKKNQAGMTLVEVMISIFVVSISVLALAGNMGFYHHELKNLQAKSSQTDVVALIREMTKDPAALYNSGDMHSNLPLNKCLQGMGSNPCENAIEKEFNFYSALRTVPVIDPITHVQALDPNGKPIFNPEPIAGVSTLACDNADSFPVFYTAEGQRCACGDDPTRCPIQAVGTYTAYCDSGTSCQRPRGLKVGYQMRLRSDLPANFNMRLSDKGGHNYVFLNNDDYYIKFVYGASFNTDINSGNQYVSYSVGEYEIRQGNILNYQKPAIVKMNVSFSAKQDVATVELWRYTYPVGCNSDTIGTIGVVDCHAPASNEFVKIKTQPVLLGKTGLLDFSDSILDNTIVEYKLIAYGGAGNVVVQSMIPLRVGVMENGYVNVAPPSTLTYVCDINAESNKFIFTANASKYGWKSVNATFNPPLIGGNTDWPNFSAIFDKTNPAPQKLSIDPSLFVEGATYEITFTGITGNDFQRVSKKTFLVGTKPQKGVLSITNPVAGSKVRVIQDLMFESTINLGCGKTINHYGVELKPQSGGSVVMPETEIKSSCSPIAGAPDENRFLCSKNFTCDQWLNVSDPSQCLSKFGSDTDLNANFKLIDQDGNPYSASTTFTAGSKISVNIQKDFVQFVTFKTNGITIPATTNVNVQFSSKLLTTETVGLKLNGPNGKVQSFSCKGSGSGSKSTYNSATGVCTLFVDTPTSASDSGVYTLATDIPSSFPVINPKTVTFKWIDDGILSCSSYTAGIPNCSAKGKNLKRKLDTLGTYNNSFWSNSSSNSLSYSLLNTADDEVSVDFFIYYRPTSSGSNPALELSLTFGQNSTDLYIARKKWNENQCSAPDRCEADYTQVLPDFYASKKVWGSSFGIQLTNIVNFRHELVIVRQCYCQ